jgi:hypothetical protein
MAAFLTVNALFILFSVLCILVIVLWGYARNVNTRLGQSIKLMNDLYQLHQGQARTLADLLDNGENIIGNDSVNNVGNGRIESADKENSIEGSASSPSPLMQRLAGQVSGIIKAELVDEVAKLVENAQINEKALINITKLNEKLSKRVLALENQTQLLQKEDPELKMYNRAHQLVKEGVSIEDIMEASQLPRAEVEVLVGLQRHKKPSGL